MKELKTYYNRANVTYGIFLGFAFVGVFYLFGMTSFWGLVQLFVLVTLSTPAFMARNDLIDEMNMKNEKGRK